MQIDIADISVDTENFRHDSVKTDEEAMRLLLSDEKLHKVSELAQDIVEQGGLDPSSLLIVTEDQEQPGKYIALEGNRRITALKTLISPDKASGLPSYAKFKSLQPKFAALGIAAVECVVLGKERAAIWIKRKHYKGMGGAGVLAWNAVATARSDATEGKFTRWMTALAYLERHGVDAEDIRDRISSKTTTVERVLSSPYVTTILGLIFGNGTLEPENGDEARAVELVRVLLEAMSEKDFVETEVSLATQQESYVTNFSALNVKKVRSDPSGGEATEATATANGSSTDANSAATTGAPTSTNAGGGSTATNPANAGGGQSNGSAGKPGGAGGTTTPRAKPVKVRKMLAAPGLRISNQPLNKFYSELRGLNAEKNQNISAAIIRIFVEKSSTVFLETMGIPPLNNTPGATWHDFDVKLKTKVQAVLKHVDPSGGNPKLEYARDVANGNRDKLHTADHLNRAVHSHHALPSHSEIITIWDRLHPYFAELFEAIEKKKP